MITLVLGKDDVPPVLEHHPNFVVSIIAAPSDGYPETPPEWFEALDVPKLLLAFDDVDQWQNPAGYIGATRKQIEQLVEFAHGVGGMGVVHCAAGIGRSAAAAIVMHAVHDEPEPVLAMLEGVSHAIAAGFREDDFVLPNRRVIDLAAIVLERPELYKLVEARFRGRYESRAPYERVDFTNQRQHLPRKE